MLGIAGQTPMLSGLRRSGVRADAVRSFPSLARVNERSDSGQGRRYYRRAGNKLKLSLGGAEREGANLRASTFLRWGSAARRRAGRRAKSDDSSCYHSEEHQARITACPRLRGRIRVLNESSLCKLVPSATSESHSWLSKRLRDVMHGSAQCLTSATAKPDTSQASSSVSAANRIGDTGARWVSPVRREPGCQQLSGANEASRLFGVWFQRLSPFRSPCALVPGVIGDRGQVGT
ncbi:hypothetical protein PYCCODRAFT_82675 [Trametes coccinea BRFM310]|uniref:Uncharacterized protein n=1 Tax=Trametes coccinea (strain BRFM310) TaxID=1353009 RepID=A0A1Y2IXH1_TRAC3|nr:hypothetical protein PYCCODRAFT_82675 [Trametes coccinea BRFM310]